MTKESKEIVDEAAGFAKDAIDTADAIKKTAESAAKKAAKKAKNTAKKFVNVFSTLSGGVACVIYAKTDPKQPNKAARKIVINGGANVANKFVQTPKGTLTRVNPSDYELLKDHPNFQGYVERGFVTVDLGNQLDVDSAVKNMEPKDKSAPKTEEDHPSEKVAK